MKTRMHTPSHHAFFGAIRPLVLGTALLGSVLSLSGCFPLAAGGALMTGFVAADRRSSGTQLEDQNIELKAANQMRLNIGERAHINVTSYNRQALITGEVPTAQDKQFVEQIVSRVENVTSVVNELAVMNTPSLMDRSADLLITGRLKAAILDDKELQSNAFKVVTERGTIYLMGRVTKREADRVTNLARSTSGARRVVRVFEEISEDQLRRLQPEANPPAAAPVKL